MRVKVVFDGTPAGTITLEDRLQYLPPVGGALLQEAIDVAVILNALRAL
ncbi:hypothetical protein QMO80_005729 (plasmid) [Rhizobium sp. BT03]|uniref:Cation transport ATPase n=2 Tax=Rhizobium TaxID=379 RepID=A0A7W6ZNY4_RHIET|nr:MULTISPECIES: hypothetical protein [Rhizobium]ANL12401.1 cation transport ATPase domain-containing protein [Rhizobium sp. N1341]MBB4483255.1 cation transport ATPase [Rhizobium etli]MBB4539084.1 cation transport ATPase [Rhizobium etli]WHO76556.1 hypothetical protein QMO80_005729 [Rhizobium sp. BT03]